MKQLKPRYIFILLMLCLSTSCDKDFGDINTNPLAPSNVADGALFNAIVSSLRLGWNRQLFLHNEVLYDVTEQAVVTAKTFGNVSGGSEDVWENYYTALKNAKELYRRFDANEDLEIGNVMKAQLDILMAYKTFQVTDLYGDIPYEDAGESFAEDAIFQASYTSQEVIYKSLIEDLENATLVLSNGGQTALGNNYTRYGNFETLFNDNLSLWLRLSNSLQLRHLIRMYEKDPEYVNPRVKYIIDNGLDVIIKDGDALMMPRAQMWSNLGVNWSFREHNKVRMGTTMWDYLSENNEPIDPRLNIFFEPNVNDEWAPFPQIAEANTPQSGGEPYSQDRRDAAYENKGEGNIYSAVNFYLVRDEDDIPEILMSSAEVKFLLSEIFLRGIGVEADIFLAKSNYELGMFESLEFWQDLMVDSEIWVNKPDIFSSSTLFGLISNPRYALDPGASEAENLEKIYAQRWIDAFRQPWEAFSLLRRTNLLPRTKPDNDFHRFQYPPSEAALNVENYQAQASEMGGDESNVKVWWAD